MCKHYSGAGRPDRCMSHKIFPPHQNIVFTFHATQLHGNKFTWLWPTGNLLFHEGCYSFSPFYPYESTSPFRKRGLHLKLLRLTLITYCAPVNVKFLPPTLTDTLGNESIFEQSIMYCT